MIRIAAIFALCLAVLAPFAGANPKNKPRPRDGDYNVSIGGYFKGEGTGTINGDQIKFQLSVMSDTGSKGVLVAPNLTITGNHFAGPGNFQGHKVTFDGRVDAPDNDLEHGIKGVRVVATVKTADGKFSRLVGYIPALAAAKDPGEEDRNRDKH
jgi:hypothetical protein